MGLPDVALAHMRRQAGVVARRQLTSAGVSASTVDTMVQTARLEVCTRGVYRLPGSPGAAEQQLWAAVLRTGDGARLTGWTACALYGIEGFDLRECVWVAIPSRRRVRGFDGVLQRADIPACDRARVRGLPAVTPIRAIIDAAMRVRDRRIRVGIDAGRRTGMVDDDRLRRRADELGRHAGAVTVRRLLGSGALDQDGELERQLALALHEVGLHPAWGVEVLPGVIVDACFAEASYVLECDGVQWHTIDTDRAADVSRQGILRADGWRVDRIGTADLRDRRAETVAAIVATRAARIEVGLGRPREWSPVHPGRRLRPARA